MMQSRSKRERLPVRQLLLTAAAAMLCCPSQNAAASRPKLSLAQKTAAADAIVVGKVAEIEGKRYSLTLFKKGSFGKQPAMTTLYDLAVLHPQTVIKTDCTSMVNKADGANPIAWMHMAFETPGQPRVISYSGPAAGKGDHRVWFLRHDTVLTGNYFLRESEAITAVTIREIKALVASQSRAGAAAVLKPPREIPDGAKEIDTPEIIRILEKEAIASFSTTHSQDIHIRLKDGRTYVGTYEWEKAGKYAKDPQLVDILNLTKHILAPRPGANIYIDTPEIIRILEKETLASVSTYHSQRIHIRLKDGRMYVGTYEQEKAGKYSKDPKMFDILNLTKHILDKRPPADVKGLVFKMQ